MISGSLFLYLLILDFINLVSLSFSLNIPNDKMLLNLDKLYDQIRMLDHEDYSRANIKFGNFLLTFSEPLIKNNLIKTICTIKKEHKAL